MVKKFIFCTGSQSRVFKNINDYFSNSGNWCELLEAEFSRRDLRGMTSRLYPRRRHFQGYCRHRVTFKKNNILEGQLYSLLPTTLNLLKKAFPIPKAIAT